jgi:hypothetical protein
MKKMSKKGYVLGIIILLMVSSIASSAAVKGIKYEQTAISTEETILNSTDPNIMEIIEMINESLLREFLTVLAVEIGPRKTGTYGTEKAAEYMYDQFTDMGLEVRYQHWASFNDRSPFRYYKDKNVEATLKGIDDSNDEVLVFNAHYDTTKRSPGAVDDGSGVAAVLAAAYVLSQFTFNRTIKFVAFSGEEIGLLGSRAYATEQYKENTDILVEFNADMIGYAVTADEGRNISVSSTEDSKWIVDEIKDINENYGINFNVRTGWTMRPGGERHGSDYYDFVLYGYEAVAFWESGNYRKYMHTPEDTIDKVNFSYLTNMTRLIAASLAHMADIDVYYPQIRIGAPRRGRLYFEDRTLKKYKFERTIVIDDVLIYTEVKAGDAPIEKVEFYYDGKLAYTDTDMPYQWRLNKLSIRKHRVEVILHDEIGRTARDQVTFRFINICLKK